FVDDLMCESREFARRLIDTHAGQKAPDGTQMMAPRPTLRHVILERAPHVGLRCEDVFETLRHYADDRVVVAFKSDVATDNCRVGVKSAPPQLIAENQNVRSVQPVVGWSKVAAE